MSRHTRHRLAEQRRPGPAGRSEATRPVRLATPETAIVDTSGAIVDAPDAIPAGTAAVEPAPTAVPMATLHVPSAAADVVEEGGGSTGAGCTPAQLRRFIKSRAYLPVHEIRRRFGIETADDDVTGFQVDAIRVFVGLPQREGRILGDLVRAGEVGYELQLDPEAPIIVGVYPMRPVTRQ